MVFGVKGKVQTSKVARNITVTFMRGVILMEGK